MRGAQDLAPPSPASATNTVDHPRLPTSPSLTPAKPLRRQAPKSDQPTPEDLAKLGITVRDFAYESTLPPIRSYVPRQIQPRLPPLPQLSEADVGGSSSQKIRRGPHYTRHVRQPALASMGEQILRPETSLGFFGSSQQSDYSTPSSSQPPLSYYAESQESEAYIPTPTVTPNGSLQWDIEDTSNEPASQLDARSQNPEPELFSYAELGFIDPNGQSQSQHQPSRALTEPLDSPQPKSQHKISRVPTEVASNISSPLSSPPGSLPSISASYVDDDSFVATTHQSPLTPLLTATSGTPPPVTTASAITRSHPAPSSPRYFLRKRPAPPSALSTVSRPHSRPRRDPHQPNLSPPLTSIRSAHAKTKLRGGPKASRPLAIRRSARPTPVR